MLLSNFALPPIFLLAVIILKEGVPYDSEKIVISCILSFILITYYWSSSSLSEVFQLRALKLQEEFNQFLDLKIKLENKIKNFWLVFLNLESQLVDISRWKKNLAKRLNDYVYNHRNIFPFHLIKDQISNVVKEKTTVDFKLESIENESILSTFKTILDNDANTDIKFYNANIIFTVETLNGNSKLKNNKISVKELIDNYFFNQKEYSLDNILLENFSFYTAIESSEISLEDNYFDFNWSVFYFLTKSGHDINSNIFKSLLSDAVVSEQEDPSNEGEVSSNNGD